jgi:hypothetical protein
VEALALAWPRPWPRALGRALGRDLGCALDRALGRARGRVSGARALAICMPARDKLDSGWVIALRAGGEELVCEAKKG